MAKIHQFPKSPQYQLRRAPARVPTMDEIIDTGDFDFAGEWQNSLQYLQANRIHDQVLEHEVTLIDIGLGLSIAHHLKQDRAAVRYFTTLLCDLTDKDEPTIRLLDIPAEFRGYVWSLNWHNISNAQAYVRYKLDAIIGRPLIRQTYF